MSKWTPFAMKQWDLSHEKVLVQAESCSRGFVFDKVAEVGVTCIVISKTGICAAPYTRDKLQKCRDTKVWGICIADVV